MYTPLKARLNFLNRKLIELANEDSDFDTKIEILKKLIPKNSSTSAKIYNVDKIYLQSTHEYQNIIFNNFIVLLQEFPGISFKMSRKPTDTGEVEILEGDTITCEIVDGKLLKVNTLQRITS
jgi:arginine/lysine/ornithine decarboxylase